MSNIGSNTVYICNIQDDVNKFNKQFEYNVVPSDYDMSVSFNSVPMKYDDTVYKRGGSVDQSKHVINVSTKTKSVEYNNNINVETNLRNVKLTNNDTNLNNYLAKPDSNMYKLNVPYEQKKGKHDLLFEIPNFSNSAAPPVKDKFAFRNFTREQRNLF